MADGPPRPQTKRIGFADVRDMTRHDKQHFEWLVKNEFFPKVGYDRYEPTAAGRAAADLGFYDWQPQPRG